MIMDFKIFAACKVLANYTVSMDVYVATHSIWPISDVLKIMALFAVPSWTIKEVLYTFYSLNWPYNFTPIQSISIAFNIKTVTLVNEISFVEYEYKSIS